MSHFGRDLGCPVGQVPFLTRAGPIATAVAANLVVSILIALAPSAAVAQPAEPGAPPEPDQAPAGDQPPEPDEAPAGDPPAESDAEILEEQESEVIVIDSRSEKPLGNAVGAIEVVDRNAIRARGARNVGDALRGHVGLEVVPARRGTAIRALGLDPSYLLVLIDGLPAIGRIDGALDLDRFPVDGVERIEVVKGPSSALYGSDALAGVVNVVTREAKRPFSSEASATYGSRERIDASASAAGRRTVGPWKLSSRAGFGMRRSDAFDLEPDTAGTEGSDERAWDGGLRVAAERGRWRLVAAGDYLRQDLRGVDNAPVMGQYDRRTLTENAAATLAAAVKLRDDTSVTGTLRHSTFRDQFLYDLRDSPTVDYELTNERLTSGSALANTLVTPAHLLVAGLDGSAEGLSSDRLATDGSRERLGVYAQDEWLVLRSPQLILVPGARLDLDSQFGAHATPKLSARWDVSEQVIARLGAGGGYRAPDFRQLHLLFNNTAAGYRIEGNPDLKPEKSLGVNLSVEIEPIEPVAVAVQGYWNDVDDLIAIEVAQVGSESSPTLFRYENIGSARTRGVEVQARARLGQRLVGMLGYSLSDTLDREADRELPERSRHRGSFELRFRPLAGLQLATHGELVGRRSFFADTDGDPTDEERLRSDRYAWIGARAELEIGANLSVFAGADNIADAGDSRFLPIAPRSFYAGVRGHYDLADPAQPTRLAGP